MSKVKLLWKAPSVALAQRGPRVLEFLNREGKTEFFAPEMDENGNILYDVNEEYGRRLLAGQSDRFFLVSPPKLIVKKRRKDNMGSEYVTIKAINGMTPPPPLPSDAGDGSQGPDGTPADAKVPDSGTEVASGSGESLDVNLQAAADAGARTTQRGGPAAHPDKHKPNRPAATA